MLSEKKILLIDGDEGIRKSLSLFFGSRHCLLNTAENGTQGLLAIDTKHYDIILCEELLPDMNGLNFFKIIDARCYEAIKILISCYGTNKKFAEFRDKGIDYLLTKPFSGDDIEAAITRLISSRSPNNGPPLTYNPAD